MADTSTALVTTPFEMAKVLFNASPYGAAAYTLAAHETACELGDETRMAFWHDVGRELEIMRRDLEARPILKVA